ncbi:MAG: MBL fold metallo-hydrolase [Acidimicrobiales bacterium]
MTSGERHPTVRPGGELLVRFFGVRGSTPCCSPEVHQYGGNTSCVVVEAPGAHPILLDLGTGCRIYGESLDPAVPFRATALVSHLHWDHVQGLPFFGPAPRPGSHIDLLAPPPGSGMTLGEALDTCLRPPFFPVTVAELPGTITVREAEPGGTFPLGPVTVTARTVPHVGPTAGFRLEWEGASLAYIPDHQQPGEHAEQVDEQVLALARGVDLLIHDAQYTPEEFAAKSNWGHSTVPYAVEVARRAEARTLALFHHDPLHDDATVDQLLGEARLQAGCGFDVIAAREGLTLRLPAGGTDAGPAHALAAAADRFLTPAPHRTRVAGAAGAARVAGSY